MHTDKTSHPLPPLTPRTAPWMQEVMEDHSLLSKLLQRHGSPINLHHLTPFGTNYRGYKSVLDRYNLKSTIFFARKANKCQGFVKEAQRIGFGVDTASYCELKQCLDAGLDSNKLICTAAAKSERLLRLALIHDVMILLDNKDECRMVNKLALKLRKDAHVGIRLSGFNSNGRKLYSRFGFDVENVFNFITSHFGNGKEFCNLNFKGFHFHLDGYSIKQRGEALHQTIKLARQLQDNGISTAFIDIGGGLLVNYLSRKKEWQTFWDALKKAVRGKRAPITFGNDGLGYKMIDGQLQGSPDVYPYYNERPKEHFLDEVLDWKSGGRTAASLIREQDIEFRMEPGRSLLDQCGMSIARVVHRKKDQHGSWLIGLEMNRSQLQSSSADFLVDPLFAPVQSSGAEKNLTPAYLTGAYCLEQDIILKRKIVLPHLPYVGDVIGFPNTAGYMMHFYETKSHLLAHAPNLVTNSSSPFNFINDENF